MSTLSVRRTVVEMCVQLSNQGYFSGTGGNIALRIDKEHIAVTPSATDYYSMVADDVCVLRLTDLQQVEGNKAPSVESGLHAQVLRARPDVNASIHTHQPVASACALLGRPLNVPLGPLRRLLGEVIPVAGYAPSGSSWLSSKLAKKISASANAYLMLNHGVLCCGANRWAALQAIEDLEALCQSLLLQRITVRSEQEPHRRASLQRVANALTA